MPEGEERKPPAQAPKSTLHGDAKDLRKAERCDDDKTFAASPVLQFAFRGITALEQISWPVIGS